MLVVTALGVERDAFRDVVDSDWLGEWDESFSSQGNSYLTRSLRCRSGIAAVALIRAGVGDKVTAPATDFIKELKPRQVVMCGICAGIPKKVSLGDVIFATQAFKFFGGKVTSDGVDREFDSCSPPPRWAGFAQEQTNLWSPTFVEERPRALPSQEVWVLYMLRHHGVRETLRHPEQKHRCPDWSLVVSGLQGRGLLKRSDASELTTAGKELVDQLEPQHAILNEEDLHAALDAGAGHELADKPFRLHSAPLATVDKVRGDGTLFKEIVKAQRKVLGLEMEGYRLGLAARTEGAGNIVLIKGVADLGDPEKDDRYHNFAARASAAFLLEALKKSFESASSQLSYEEKRRRLSEEASNRLKDQLGKNKINEDRRESEKKGGGFFQKFISPIYEPRGESESIFSRFLEQKTKRCYLASGKAGKGKTSLLCRLAEKTNGKSYGDVLPVLIDSAVMNLDPAVDDLTDGVRQSAAGFSEETATLGWYISSALETRDYRPDLSELCELLKQQNRTMVVFFDAINELHGDQPFSRFNTGFAGLVRWVEKNDYPLLFCISCRTDFLIEFQSVAWPVFERLGGEATKPTFELGDYDVKIRERITRRYLAWYGIRVALSSTALERCQDPLMLRYLCMAYTERPFYDKREENFTEKIISLPRMSTLRRKEVFDSFVTKKRAAIAKKVGVILKGRLGGKDPAPKDYYRYASFYLLHIANRMYQKRKTSLSALEILEVAEELDHPDARLGDENLSPQEKARLLVEKTQSVFFHFLDEGIILEPVQDETRRIHSNNVSASSSSSGTPRGAAYQFVFETYLEYTLGRYFTQVRWPKLTESGGTNTTQNPDVSPEQVLPEQILKDFDGLLNRHGELVSKGRFTNLFGALQFAVLITEDAEIYEKSPDLFLRMLHRMSFMEGAQRLRQLDWAQQACATIRETFLAQPIGGSGDSPSKSVSEHPSNVLDPSQKRAISAKEMNDNVEKTLGLLESLVRSSDFVIMWDVRDTLAALGRFHTQSVVKALERWVLGRPDANILLPMSALESLEQLSEGAPHEALDLLIKAGEASSVTGSFWLARSWVHAVSVILQRRRFLLAPEGFHESDIDLGLSENSEERAQQAKHYQLVPDASWQTVLGTLRIFAGDSTIPFIRGVALPALSLVQNDRETSAFIGERLEQEPSRWVLWNLAFELRRWSWGLGRNSEVWRYLSELGRRDDQHICYAVDSTALHYLEKHGTADAQTVRRAVQDKPWKAFPWEGEGPERKIMRSREAAALRTGIAYTPAYFEASYDNHIECRERLQSMMSGILQLDAPPIDWIHPSYAKDEALQEVHGQDADGEYIDSHRGQIPWPTYLADIRHASAARRKQKGRAIRSGPSELRYESYEAAKLSAGGAVAAVNYVVEEKSTLAWSMGRPPGHLANNQICIFNNVAIGATQAMDRMRETGLDPRIVIIDCDAHLGKHTCRVFEKNPSVVYFSLHIDDAYAAEQGPNQNIGTGQGRGYSFNVPYPPNTTDLGYQFLIDHLLVPVIDDFQPNMIMISAGFDGHFEDPLTPGCILTERSYIHLAKRLRESAERSTEPKKFVGVLEGGYGLESIAKSLAHMLNILGDWGFAEEEIGFVSREGYEEKFPDAAK